ncbi:hypothetical protein [Actinoplanes awajinensis]|uniref:Uncharacterized protein n=1 Tax=Actinoplanes awajinensis subsp. mycoplanecinus TaxID=135947 RepID=A0A0X3V5L8_9ACTN|nr:hypothetical protein [Actinoplanes awajinensis]KUL39944.1 hypothetical protein ADL15_08525 [Actinoplanes awajinensis subsp. mycoplanecinus]
MRGGLLSLLLKIVALWFAATLLAWPAAVLTVPATPGEPDRQLGWAVLWLLLTPATALATAWWYRPDRLGLRPLPLLGRAAGVLAAPALTVVAWDAAGMPWWSVPGLAGGNVVVAVLACILAWAALDRLPPAYLAVAGVVALAGAAGLGAATGAESAVAVVTGSTTTTGSRVWIGVALAIVQLVALAVVGLAGWRLFDQWRTGTLSHATDRRQGHWPPKPGQIWYADVPFAESDDSKDRPVLVLRTAGRQAEVLKITSQDKSKYPQHYLFLPYAKWHRVLDRDSWLELRPQRLDYPRFRNLRGLARFGTVRAVKGREDAAKAAA